MIQVLADLSSLFPPSQLNTTVIASCSQSEAIPEMPMTPIRVLKAIRGSELYENSGQNQ